MNDEISFLKINNKIYEIKDKSARELLNTYGLEIEDILSDLSDIQDEIGDIATALDTINGEVVA